MDIGVLSYAGEVSCRARAGKAGPTRAIQAPDSPQFGFPVVCLAHTRRFLSDLPPLYTTIVNRTLTLPLTAL
jgi:hypothetical protein